MVRLTKSIFLSPVEFNSPEIEVTEHLGSKAARMRSHRALTRLALRTWPYKSAIAAERSAVPLIKIEPKDEHKPRLTLGQPFLAYCTDPAG